MIEVFAVPAPPTSRDACICNAYTLGTSSWNGNVHSVRWACQPYTCDINVTVQSCAQLCATAGTSMHTSCTNWHHNSAWALGRNLGNTLRCQLVSGSSLAYLLYTICQGEELLIAHTVQSRNDKLRKLGPLLVLGVLPAGHTLPPVLPLSIVFPHKVFKDCVTILTLQQRTLIA